MSWVDFSNSGMNITNIGGRILLSPTDKMKRKSSKVSPFLQKTAKVVTSLENSIGFTLWRIRGALSFHVVF